jgi:Amt family ammonium transporter
VTVLSLAEGLNNVWVVLAAALVVFMEGGFGLLEAGFVQAKNMGSIILKVWMDLTAGSLAYWAVGFALMYGADRLGLFGASQFLARGSSPVLPHDLSPYAFWLFQAAFAIAAVSIVSGAVAERMRPRSYLLFVLVMCAVIYPVSGHWVWGGGWLGRLGMEDFAGSGVVHAVGGWAALAAAMALGSRQGRWTGGVSTTPASLTLAAAGCFILWFGWFGFNAGSTLSATAPNLALVAVNTQLAAAAGGLVGFVWPLLHSERCDAGMAMNGGLAGLVAVTAGCAFVGPASAVLIGAAAGVVVNLAFPLVERWRVDDPVGAIAVHGFNGAWGVLAVGLFATRGGLFTGGGVHLLAVQALGLAAVSAWGFGATWLTFKVLRATVGIRVTPEEEAMGLDAAWRVHSGLGPDDAADQALAGRAAMGPIDVESEPAD